ncbi:MAG: alpha/beta fold hydrolase [Halioglobus sp.]
MKWWRKLLFSLAITPLIYLLIALTLTLLPVQRQVFSENLDFSVLPSRDSQNNTASEQHYKAKDGAQLFYRQIIGNQAQVVILIHGSGSEGRYLLGLANTLNADTGTTVIVPDLRGHGRSMNSHPGDVSYLGQYLDDLSDLHHHLRAQFPQALIILGGHSSGGGLAVKTGGSPDASFDAYLLLAPYLGYQSPTVRPDSGGWVQVSTRRYAGLSMLNQLGIRRFNDRSVLFFNRPVNRQDELQLQSYSYRLNESFGPQDFKQDLGNNAMPILALVGEDDEAFYADQFPPLFQQYAPGAQLHVLAGVKHLDLPDSSNAADKIVDWLLTLKKKP